MARVTTLSWISVCVLLAACGSEPTPNAEPQEPPLTADTLGDQAIVSPSDYLADPRFASADRKNGKTRAQLCRACHSLEADGPNLVGPSLHGFFGKRVGAVEGYDYSAALRDANFIWTPRALDAWLAQPARFLPGNRMAFPGVLREADRIDLIAYLLDATDDNSNK